MRLLVLTTGTRCLRSFPVQTPESLRLENIEKAIEAYNSALEIFTFESYAREWAYTQQNLGNAYQERIFGDKAENLEWAITSFESSLKFYSEEEFPEVWATVQNSLGITYCFRIRGEKEKNLEDAIQSFNNALKVYKFINFSRKWAAIKTNLGNAYRERMKGNKSENIEEAISSFQDALRVRTFQTYPIEWATTQNNLGAAYYERLKGNRKTNLEKAREHYQSALQVRNLESFSSDWAMTQYNLGNVFSELQKIKDALVSYRLSLQVYIPIEFPNECFKVGRALGNISTTNELWVEALDGYSSAIEAVEISRVWTASESRRLEILEEAMDIYESIVTVSIRNGEISNAVEYVERSRAKRLVDLIASNDLYQTDEISPEVGTWLTDRSNVTSARKGTEREF